MQRKSEGVSVHFASSFPFQTEVISTEDRLRELMPEGPPASITSADIAVAFSIPGEPISHVGFWGLNPPRFLRLIAIDTGQHHEPKEAFHVATIKLLAACSAAGITIERPGPTLV